MNIIDMFFQWRTKRRFRHQAFVAHDKLERVLRKYADPDWDDDAVDRFMERLRKDFPVILQKKK